MADRRCLIGITADAEGETFRLSRSYAEMVVRAGGAPLILPCVVECVADYLELCDGFILSGGGGPTPHEGAEERRQKAAAAGAFAQLHASAAKRSAAPTLEIRGALDVVDSVASFLSRILK